METLTEVTVRYLRAQVAAGVQVVQLFDSWMGDLGRREYEAAVLPYSRRIFEAVRATGVPTIHFGTGTVGLLESMAGAGSDLVSVDWRVPLDEAWRRIGPGKGIQGNLDPAVLLAPSRSSPARPTGCWRRPAAATATSSTWATGSSPTRPPTT